GSEACDEGAANGTLPSCCAATCQFKAAGTTCDDGNACTTSDACNGGSSCVGGAAPDCDDHNVCTADSCDTATGCVHDGPARDGFACDDHNGCTQGDVCSSGQCAGTSGADSDGDGYCDATETAVGCNPNDPAEIPAQATTYGGGHGAGDILVTFLAPTDRKVARATDPSCAAAGRSHLRRGGRLRGEPLLRGGQDRRSVHGERRLQPAGQPLPSGRELRRGTRSRGPASVPVEQDGRHELRAADARLLPQGGSGD